MAEASGCINLLTERVLYQACSAAAHWPAELHLSVNISPLQVQDPTLPERLHQVLEQTGYKPHRLVLEVTEASLVGDFDQASAVLGALKAVGARVALDDFGVGFYGLRYLQLLPVDELKIDAAFVRAMARQRESRKIVAAVVGLGQALGLGRQGRWRRGPGGKASNAMGNPPPPVP